MDRFFPRLVFAGLAACGFASAELSAQSNLSSFQCARPEVTCLPIAGSVVFEPGDTPPVEASIRVRFVHGDDSSETLELRASAPDYRFEVRAPRFLTVSEFRLVGLPTPWMDDGVVDTVPSTRIIQVRSAAGVPVTATFRYPMGTTAPPPFMASVQRSPGDRWFTPVEVTNGQFTFLARRDIAYAIAASPQGFGNIAATFQPQAFAHAVFVDVQRRARPAEQQAILVEGPGPSPGMRRAVMLPLLLEERSPSGGGPLPYDITVQPGTALPDTVVGSTSPDAGRQQRIALQRLAITDDGIVNPARSVSLRFTANPADAPAVADLPITLLDDEGTDLPPLLTVAGASLRAGGTDAAMVLARAEGAPGDAWTLTLELDRPAPEAGAAVTVDTVTSPDLSFPNPFFFRYSGVVAREGIDFQPLVQQRVTFAAGQRTATVRIEGIGNSLIQPERRLHLAFTSPEGLAPRDPAIELRILNDDVDGSPAARNDQLPVSPLRQSNVLDIFANDVLPADRFVAGRLEIDAAQFGVVSVDRRGTPNPLDDRIVYSPNSGQAGKTESMAYRLCAPFDEICVSARLEIPIRPVAAAPTAFAPESEAGFRDIAFSGVTVLSDARAELYSRPIDASEVTDLTIPPSNPRFGFTWQPASTGLPTLTTGQVVRRTFVAHLRGSEGSDVDLHVAYDANNDGNTDASERLCSSSMSGANETCLVRFEQTPAGARTLQVSVTNPGPQPVPARLVVGSVESIGILPGVVATVPTRITAGAGFTTRLSWRNDSTSLPNGVIGFLRINNDGDIGLGDVPVVIDLPRFDNALARAPALAPVAFRSGVARPLQVPVGGARDRAFIDVPAGTGQLAVALSRTGILNPLEVSLRRVDLPAGGADAAPAVAPTADASSITRSMTGATLEIVVGSPAAGRWYLVLKDNQLPTGGQIALQATATLSTGSDAPVVRPGGYFNASRSGHGLFLYPAGAEWAGLWYTYQQDGEPVWYYLQGPAPGANGVWTAPIFRSGWNGARNRLVEIGRAIATPTGPDAFQFTYVLDGETGSEPFTTFGRGCPTIDSRVVNASGHWFDPVRAGAGYSVQMFPNYEFHAVFAYSPRGEPRFLLAERAGVGAANDTVPLQQLQGFCPLCTRSGNPARSNAGVLRRVFTNGVLTGINVDATFTNGTTGTWVVNDAVVPLGGLQGCAVN